MDEILGLDSVKNRVKSDLDSSKDILLFAFNGTGKTRLSCSFGNHEEIESLNYNALMEDYFTWDNESKTMKVSRESWFFNFIKDEGLEKEINIIFNKFTENKIEPVINFDEGNVQFIIINKQSEREAIKISRGEESLFKWSVFYAVLKQAIEILQESPEGRSTDIFDNLKYIILDDPMTSLDEFKLYTLSMQILDTIKHVHEKGVGVAFLICTHHSLFYNILFNTLRNRNSGQRKKCLFYTMNKLEDGLLFNEVDGSKPMAFHLQSLQKIKSALDANTIKKLHYNMFRSVLEKCSVFLGFNNWQDLFVDYVAKDEFCKVVNMNSHEQYSDIEIEYLTQEQIDILKDGFNYFIKIYKIKL